jgi:hypothetical protein
MITVTFKHLGKLTAIELRALIAAFTKWCDESIRAEEAAKASFLATIVSALIKERNRRDREFDQAVNDFNGESFEKDTGEEGKSS